MSGRAKKWSKAALRETVSHIVWSYWPIWGAPILGVILGYLGGYAPVIIFLFALGAFALIALGLNNITQWSTARSPARKVRFMVPTVGVHLSNEKVPTLLGVRLGVSVVSEAPFPMEVRLDELETRIWDRVPSEKFNTNSVILDGKGAGIQFNGAAINLSDLDLKNKTIYGHISAKISYGRPGEFNYSSDYGSHLALKFDAKGKLAVVEPSVTNFTQTFDTPLPKSSASNNRKRRSHGQKSSR
jgi:hypothetical protein